MIKTLWSEIRQKDRYLAVSDLVRDSQPSVSYYSLLALSSIIIVSGVLLSNSAMLIGGMLITPVLTPILLISLAIVTSKTKIIGNMTSMLLKSFGIVFGISFIVGLVMGKPGNKDFFSVVLFDDSVKAAFLYFIVAFMSGAAATFAWIRKEIATALPGISIAISLVPPISIVGVWLSQGNFELARFFLVVFLFNIVGIVMSSIIVFSILDFYKTGDEMVQNINTIKKINGQE